MLREALKSMEGYIRSSSGNEREYAVIMLDSVTENASRAVQRWVFHLLLPYLRDDDAGVRRAVAIALAGRMDALNGLPEPLMGLAELRKEIQAVLQSGQCKSIRKLLLDALAALPRDLGAASALIAIGLSIVRQAA